jgi:hypothetical protein
MPLFTDLKYVGSISHLLRNFKRKKDQVWCFSCPICGDSQKNKLKARGYLYRNETRLRYKCHNCGCQMSFGDLIKHLDSESYKQYLYETFLEEKGDPPKLKKEEKKLPLKKYKPLKPTVLVGCPSISSLGPDHPARQYIEGRKIPKEFHRLLFWCDDFPALIDKMTPDHKFKLRKEGRLIIPFMDRNYELLAIQGRSLEPDAELRYITVKAFEDAPRIYGQHRHVPAKLLSDGWQRHSRQPARR